MSDEGLPSGKGEFSESSKFILSFIQALLKTGYYTPGHPETGRAREGLYDGFQSLVKGRRELTLVAVTTEEKKDVLVDGVVDEPVTLSSMMLKGMGEIFIPKFIEYFERKNLSSFSIKAGITKGEFDAFMDIMSESPFYEEKESDTKERLTLELIKKQVLNVSTIFNIDLVGKKRKLPWRVEIALTRLKRDLSLIPLYKNLSKEKIVEIKNIVFNDIVRPMKNPELIKEIIVNSDLISLDIAGMGKEEFENSVTGFLHKDYLLLAAPEVLKFYTRVRDSYEKLKDERILPRLEFLKNMSKKVAFKLIDHGLTQKPVVMEYFKQGVLAIEELPEELKIKAKREEELEKFLKEPQRYFIALERAMDEEIRRKIILALLYFLPELLERNLFVEVVAIYNTLKKEGLTSFAIKRGLLNEIISAAIKKLDEVTKEEQVKMLMEMIDMMGEVSTTVLMGQLTHRNRLVRDMACEMLVKRGTDIIPLLKSTIEQRREEWQFLRNALMVIGDAGRGREELGEIFGKFLDHEVSKVREEALRGIVRVMGINAEGYVVNALKDKDLGVRKRAIWALGKIQSVSPEAIGYLIDTVKGKKEEEEVNIEQALSSVEAYPLELKEMKQFEHAIGELLSKGSGMLGRFTGRPILSERLKARACETLGVIGGESALGILKKMSEAKEPEVRTKAMESIKKIQKRLSTSAM